MKKYSRACLFFACFLCCMFSGCQKTENEPVTIVVINAWGSTETDHVTMRNIYEGFQEENPDVRLRIISMPTRAEMLRKVEDMIMVGDTLDIVIFSGMGQNRTYEFMVENDMALDLMPYLEADPEFAQSISQVNLDDWVTEKQELFTVTDVLSLSGGYWYNEEVFQQAGIVRMPQTWDEFLEMCGVLQVWFKEQELEMKPLQASGEDYLYFMDHLLAEQGNMTSKAAKNRKMPVKEEAVIKTIRQMKELYRFSGSESEDYTYLDETSLFNQGKLAICVNGVWAAPMISERIHAKYALLPTMSGEALSCESAGLGYVVGNSGNRDREQAAVRFLKYILSKPVQTRILKETGQIPSNPQIGLHRFLEEEPRLVQAASLVLDTDKKIGTPNNLWSESQKTWFTNYILEVFDGNMLEQEFVRQLALS